MSATFLAAAEDRANGHAPATPLTPLAATMAMDLASGRLSPADYAREARNAGVSAKIVAETLKRHAAAAAQSKRGASNASPAADEVLPAGTYYGRVHPAPVKVVDGIFVPAAAKPVPAASSVDASLEWLRQHGDDAKWAARAAERLGPENDFLSDLELYDEGRGGRTARIDSEGVLHLSRALGANQMIASLNLYGNAAGAEGAVHLASALSSNRTVTHLNVANNGLGDAGLRTMAEALRTNPALSEVDLSENGASDDATMELLRAAWGGRDPAKLRLG